MLNYFVLELNKRSFQNVQTCNKEKGNNDFIKAIYLMPSRFVNIISLAVSIFTFHSKVKKLTRFSWEKNFFLIKMKLSWRQISYDRST